jgi:UDP-N-acetylmuramate--alanine ligase
MKRMAEIFRGRIIDVTDKAYTIELTGDVAKLDAFIEGIDRAHLVSAIKAHGHRHAIGLDKPEDLQKIIRDLAMPGDYIVFLGAGSITQWAYALPGQLEAFDKAQS